MVGNLKFTIESFRDCQFDLTNGTLTGTFIFKIRNTGFWPFVSANVEVVNLQMTDVDVVKGLTVPIGNLFPRSEKRVSVQIRASAEQGRMIEAWKRKLRLIYNTGVTNRVIHGDGSFSFAPLVAPASKIDWSSDGIPIINWTSI